MAITSFNSAASHAMDENQPPTTPKKSNTYTSNIHTTPITFPTPRRRKTRPPFPTRQPALAPWPRLLRRVTLNAITDATERIFGYRPREWQLEVMVKVLEGNDCIVIAGTGSGKSLVYALLAIAAELAQGSGVIIVTCPLKALQEDQVSTRAQIYYYIVLTSHLCPGATLQCRCIPVRFRVCYHTSTPTYTRCSYK